ncbi:MAG: PTS sugar transporter subunit IIA [Verrucomicrobiota bacterium]
MITIADILLPKQILLNLTATKPGDAIFQVADLLKGSEGVVDWNGFYENLNYGSSCMSGESGYAMCIPHARTPHISSMVMAAGRSEQGIWFEAQQLQVHYIFVIGVPLALASDYLRIIGALARIFRSPQSEAELRNAVTRQEFIQLLSQSEMAV